MSTPVALIQPLLGPDFRPCAALTTKAQDTFRIVVTGDSYTYGLGVRAAETLPAQLGERFSTRSARPEIEVINLGCPGMSLFSGQALVHQLLDLVELDLLLLVISSDDTMPWLRDQAARLKLDWSGLWSSRWDPTGDVLGRALGAFDAIVRAVRARQRQLAVAYYEPVGATGKKAAEVIGGACRARDVTFVDLVAPFSRFEADRLVVSSADAHPSALAHRIAAAEVEHAILPMLPARTASSKEGRSDAVLTERLEALYAANADLSTVVQQTLACSALDPEDRARLAALHTRLLCAAWRLQRLRAAEPYVVWLSGTLLELERQLVLTTLGVHGFEGTDDLSGPIAQLTAAAEETAEAARAGAVDAPADARTGWAATSIAGIAARIEAQRIELERQLQCSLSAVRALCFASSSLAERRTAALAPAEVLRMASKVTEALRGLKIACAQPPDGHGVEIIVDGAVDVESDVTCAMLTGTFTTSFPRCHEFQQLNYLRLDGRSLSCTFDLPPGTVGRFALKLSLWRGGHESVIDGDTGLRRRIVGSGGAIHAYTDDLLIVPCRHRL
jgi:hypothetical protein